MNLLDDNFDAAQAAAAAGDPPEWTRTQDREPVPGYWYETRVSWTHPGLRQGPWRYYFGGGNWSFGQWNPNTADYVSVQQDYRGRRDQIAWWRGPRRAQIAGIPAIPSRS